MMKKFLLVLIFSGFVTFLFAQNAEREVKVFIDNPKQAHVLHDLNLKGEIYPTGYGWFELTIPEINKLQQLGFRYEFYTPQTDTPVSTLEAYHDYYSNITLMDSLADAFPTICKKIQAGTSAGGHPIYALKISDNVNTEENEAEVMFDGGIHGDELIGQEITIRFARYLCTRYATDPTVQNMVDNREIWLYPNVNPDGRIAMDRYNANGIDVNRDWGYMWNGEGNSPSANSQPETKALRQLVLDNQYVIHTSYHGGTEYLSYPWSYRPDPSPDNAAVDYLGALYSSTSGYSYLPYGQGYTGMYPINGASKDANYGMMGSMTWSCEVSYDKQPPASQIQTYWNYNRPAQLKMIEYAGYGIEGIVTDAVSGQPVRSMIFVGNNFPVYTDPLVGDYHKFLKAGTYVLKVVANGYQTALITNVVVAEGQSTITNIQLQPQSGHFAERVIACAIPGNNFNDESYTPAVLGAADNVNYSLGKNGWIILDMGTPIQNIEGNDFKVVEGDDSPEGYTCYVSQNMDGTWTSLGTGTGTTEFDLINAPLVNEARYIKIQDDGDGTTNAANAGFDLDDIQSLAQPSPANLLQTSFTIDDASGNGNGRLDPGETANINMTIFNSGDQAAENTSAEISCDTTYISLLSASASLGNLQSGASANAMFTVKAKENTLAGESVVLHTELTANDGNYTTSFDNNLMIGIIVEDWETGDFTKFDWAFSGDADWELTQTNPYEGVYSAKSGTISDNQSSVLQLQANVVNDGIVSFFRKTSSEADYDFLYFKIDGETKGQWSGEKAWEEVSFPVTAGEHTFSWEYTKDQSSTGGYDCSWVDYIILPRLAVPGFGTVSGTVMSKFNGQPLQGATIQLSSSLSGTYNTISASDGTYSFTNIPEENYTICSWLTDYDTLCYTISVVGNQNTVQNFELSSTVGTHDLPSAIPLLTAFPNPFTNYSTISYSLNTKKYVILEIYNLIGKKIKTLVSGNISEGIYHVVWNTTDESGNNVVKGIYILKMKSGNEILTRKLVLH